MILLVGDIHGVYSVFNEFVAKAPAEAVIIQVGDFGFWPQLVQRFVPPPRNIYFIDGNHDHTQALAGLPPFDKPVEIWPNAIYVPRGTVLELDGKKILFLGGAKSIDRKWRARFNPMGDNPVNCWFPEEVISTADVLRAKLAADRAGKIDVMVTHTPPQYVIDKYFGIPGPEWELPVDWRDESAWRVEEVWKHVDCPPLYCGHMHRSIVDGNVRILDINETFMHEQ